MINVEYLISLSALIISLVALKYTVSAFYLKMGNHLKCNYSTCSTVECEDKYISSIVIENLKDRSTVIFSIYIQIGWNIYLLVENFKENPLILKPFEVYSKRFDPLLFYSVSCSITNINDLLTDRKIKKRVVLSTTNGKFSVKANINNWSPMHNFFKNYATAIIQPVRYPYKKRNYGSKTIYLAQIENENRKFTMSILEDRSVLGVPDDSNNAYFLKSKFIKKDFESKDTLEKKFYTLKERGKIKFDKLEIVDFKKELSEIKKRYHHGIDEVNALSFFQYFILGKIFSRFQDIKIFFSNRKNNRRTNLTEKIWKRILCLFERWD